MPKFIRVPLILFTVIARPATKRLLANSGNTRIKTSTADPASSEASVGCDMAALIDAPAFQGYSCMLNQVDIKNNNNKFYFIKMVKIGEEYFVLNRWGRVGEVGQKNSPSGQGEADAVKAFCSTFKKKTGDEWESRRPFEYKEKKYTLLGTDFLSVPLVNLSKDLIGAGLSALEEVEAAVKNNESKNTLTDLTSRYYTLIPHNFARNEKPTVLETLDAIRQEKDMLNKLQ